MDSLEQNTVAENDTATSDIDIVTFGCRLNIHESEVMRDHAKSAGLTDTVTIASYWRSDK